VQTATFVILVGAFVAAAVVAAVFVVKLTSGQR
jgi:hypothetical protein